MKRIWVLAAITPDPATVFVDTADIARMTSEFSTGCTP